MTRAFSWLKVATTAFTFKTLLRHLADQPARPLLPLRHRPNFTLRDRGVNARLALCLNSVSNVKAVVAAFNQEKALVTSRGLLRDYKPSDGTF